MMPFSTGLQPRTQWFVALIGVAILLFVLNLVRRKSVREEYSLLWVFSALMLIVCAVFIQGVEKVSHAIGIYYPPAFLFLVAIALMMALQLHFSTVISSLRGQNKTLVQDVAILAHRVRELEEERARERGA